VTARPALRAVLILGLLFGTAGGLHPQVWCAEFRLRTPGPDCPVEALKEWSYAVDVYALEGNRWEIRTQVLPSVEAPSPALERILAGIRDIRRRITYAPDVWSEDPAEILRSGRGNCISHVALLEESLRALGHPFRRVHGLLFSHTGDSRYYLPQLSATPHRWVRALVGDLGWVSFDPLSPTGFPTRLHVPFKAADLSEALRGLDIEVREWD
jgi:hypothetical protein